MKLTRRTKQLLVTAFSIGIFVIPFVALGQVDLATNKFGVDFGTATGLSTKDVREVVARIINTAMGLLGIVAVVIILAGGFMWMTAGGDETKTGKAKKFIFSGVIGLAIVLTSFALARFVIESLISATLAP
ncbi:MAG: hypothetical protein ABIG71_04885 [Candidatus Uhrbacteria bacterium]